MRKKKDYKLRDRYGITIENYEWLLAKQEGSCAICEVEDNKGRALAVDHCHEKGHVRGILCDSCNFGIGKFKDNVDLLRKALAYLEQEPYDFT